jgi:ankyrin repeat protein
MRFRSWLHLVAIGFLTGAISLSAAGSPLIDAVKKQDVQTVRALLKQKANVNATEPTASPRSHWAAQRDNIQLVELLLAAGASAKAATRYNITPLYLAAVNGNAPMIERLLNAGADPNGTAEEGQTMLMTAALSGKADAVRMLLARGAKVDTKEPYKGQTALMWAAAEGNTAAVDVLLEAGADLKLKSTGGFTPLLFAVRNAHVDTTVTLLKHGANVNDATTDGSSALSVATVNAFFELASVLLDNGANPNLSDPRASPLHTVAWLRKPGADGAAGVGNTPVGTPQQVGKVTAIQLARKLLEHGANPNTRVEWNEPRFGKEGGTRAKSAEHPPGPPPSQLPRRHPLLCGGQERRHRADAAAHRVQGRPEDQLVDRRHAVDGRGRSRHVGRRDTGSIHRHAGGGAARGCEVRRIAWQRCQRANPLRRLLDGGRSRLHAALLPAEH